MEQWNDCLIVICYRLLDFRCLTSLSSGSIMSIRFDVKYILILNMNCILFFRFQNDLKPSLEIA